MADDLDDGEFWLPSQFLTDTDDADLDSSTPSSVTETESDEDEFLAELTRQVSRYSLRKDPAVSLSPQSTLCPGGVTPTGRVSPPPVSGATDHLPGGDAVSFNLLNAAAGEVVRMRLQSEMPKKGTGYFDSNNWLLRMPRKHEGFFYRQPDPVQQQLQASKFQQLWSQEMVAKQLNKAALTPPQPQAVSRSNSFRTTSNNHINRPLVLSPAAWPPLQHTSSRPPPQSPVGPGVLPVYPAKSSAGTGVFLPRRITPTEPAAPPPRNSTNRPGGGVPDKINSQTRSANGRSNNGAQAARRNTEAGRPHQAEIHLPSEWTY